MHLHCCSLLLLVGTFSAQASPVKDASKRVVDPDIDNGAPQQNHRSSRRDIEARTAFPTATSDHISDVISSSRPACQVMDPKQDSLIKTELNLAIQVIKAAGTRLGPHTTAAQTKSWSSEKFDDDYYHYFFDEGQWNSHGFGWASEFNDRYGSLNNTASKILSTQVQTWKCQLPDPVACETDTVFWDNGLHFCSKWFGSAMLGTDQILQGCGGPTPKYMNLEDIQKWRVFPILRALVGSDKYTSNYITIQSRNVEGVSAIPGNTAPSLDGALTLAAQNLNAPGDLNAIHQHCPQAPKKDSGKYQYWCSLWNKANHAYYIAGSYFHPLCKRDVSNNADPAALNNSYGFGIFGNCKQAQSFPDQTQCKTNCNHGKCNRVNNSSRYRCEGCPGFGK